MCICLRSLCTESLFCIAFMSRDGYGRAGAVEVVRPGFKYINPATNVAIVNVDG
jgi:hypothetical protein